MAFPNPPAGVSKYMSQTFNLTGSCDGGDMVYKWSINQRQGAGGITDVPVLTSGGAAPFTNWPTPGAAGSSFIYPFTPDDITIRGIELCIIPPAPGAISQPGWPAVAPGAWGNGPYLPAFYYLMPGNNATGDTMLWLPANALHARHDFPANAGMPFPGYASGNATNLTYLDLHGGGTAGYGANVMYTIYYTNP